MEFGVHYTIRLVQELDAPLLSKIKFGNPDFLPLKNFLKNHSIDFQNERIACTYIAVEIDKDGAELKKLIGYVSLTSSEIKLGDGYEIDGCAHANNYESLPAVKIARLAIDNRYQGCGVGRQLVALSLTIANDVISPAVGCRFLVTDAKTAAVNFYLKSGFTILDIESNINSPTPIMFVDLVKI